MRSNRAESDVQSISTEKRTEISMQSKCHQSTELKLKVRRSWSAFSCRFVTRLCNLCLISCGQCLLMSGQRFYDHWTRRTADINLFSPHFAIKNFPLKWVPARLLALAPVGDPANHSNVIIVSENPRDYRLASTNWGCFHFVHFATREACESCNWITTCVVFDRQNLTFDLFAYAASLRSRFSVKIDFLGKHSRLFLAKHDQQSSTQALESEHFHHNCRVSVNAARDSCLRRESLKLNLGKIANSLATSRCGDKNDIDTVDLV